MTIKEINDQKIMNFLENIKLLRSHYSFSKKKMAEIMGISVKMLSKLESGEMSKRLSAKSLLRLSAFFSISPDLLFEKLSLEEIEWVF